MQKCYGHPTNFITLQNYDNNLKITISKNSEKFIDFVHNLGMEVNHKDKTVNNIYTGTTILTLRTTCFKVDFDKNLARITALK